jgi:hypothetical protein
MGVRNYSIRNYSNNGCPQLQQQQLQHDARLQQLQASENTGNYLCKRYRPQLSIANNYRYYPQPYLKIGFKHLKGRLKSEYRFLLKTLGS